MCKNNFKQVIIFSAGSRRLHCHTEQVSWRFSQSRHSAVQIIINYISEYWLTCWFVTVLPRGIDLKKLEVSVKDLWICSRGNFVHCDRFMEVAYLCCAMQPRCTASSCDSQIGDFQYILLTYLHTKAKLDLWVLPPRTFDSIRQRFRREVLSWVCCISLIRFLIRQVTGNATLRQMRKSSENLRKLEKPWWKICSRLNIAQYSFCLEFCIKASLIFNRDCFRKTPNRNV